MSWEAINAISQLVSSIAVVLSLLYLALQVHRGTRIARISAQDSASSALRDVTKPFMENAELGRIWQQGLEDLGTLSAADQVRFFHAAYQFLKAFETIHFHYADGLLDQQLWNGWRELLRHYAVASGIAHYWKMRHDLFSVRFQKFMQSLEPPPQHLTVGSLLVESPAQPKRN